MFLPVKDPSQVRCVISPVLILSYTILEHHPRCLSSQFGIASTLEGYAVTSSTVPDCECCCLRGYIILLLDLSTLQVFRQKYLPVDGADLNTIHPDPSSHCLGFKVNHLVSLSTSYTYSLSKHLLVVAMATPTQTFFPIQAGLLQHQLPGQATTPQGQLAIQPGLPQQGQVSNPGPTALARSGPSPLAMAFLVTYNANPSNTQPAPSTKKRYLKVDDTVS